MKRRDFLKALRLGAGAAAIVPFTGLEWPKGKPLPEPGEMVLVENNEIVGSGHFPELKQLLAETDPGIVIGGRIPSTVPFWRDPQTVTESDAAFHVDKIDREALNKWWSLCDLNVGQTQHVVMSNPVGSDWVKEQFTLYAGPIPLWSFDRPGREMWTPDKELLFPAGLPLRIDPAPKVWTGVVRVPGGDNGEDTYGLVSDNTDGRVLRVQNPDTHDLYCTCITCHQAHAEKMVELGARARRRYLKERQQQPPRFFPQANYTKSQLDALVQQRTQLIVANTLKKENS